MKIRVKYEGETQEKKLFTCVSDSTSGDCYFGRFFFDDFFQHAYRLKLFLGLNKV